MAIDNNVYYGYHNSVFEYQYAMEESTFYAIQDGLIKGDITGYSLSGLLTNNGDYVVNVQYFPFDITKLYRVTQTTTMILGKTAVTGYTVSTVNGFNAVDQKYPLAKWFSFTFVRRYNNFLDFSPYTEVTLYTPFFNPIKLDPKLLYGHTLDGYLTVDRFSGKGVLYLYLDDNLFLDQAEGQLSINIPFGQSNAEEQRRNNIMQMISVGGSVAGLMIGAYSGNPLVTAGSVGGLTKTINSAIQNNTDRMAGYHGGNGNRTGLPCDKTIFLAIQYPKDPKVPDLSLRGGVCLRNVTLSSLTGYTEVQDIHFNPMNNEIYQNEIEEIVSLLKSGVIL